MATPGAALEKVVGCAGHNVGPIERAVLQNPAVFSMANIRDVADRIVSGFFYTFPHSPACARQEDVVRQNFVSSPRGGEQTQEAKRFFAEGCV